MTRRHTRSRSYLGEWFALLLAHEIREASQERGSILWQHGAKGREGRVGRPIASLTCVSETSGTRPIVAPWKDSTTSMARWPSQPTQRPPTKLAWRNRRSARATSIVEKGIALLSRRTQASAIAEKCKSPMTDKLSVSAVVDEKSCVPPPGAYRFYSMSPGRHRAAFVPASGQCWTTLGGLRGTHTSKFRRLDRRRHSRSAVARGTCTFPLSQQTPGQDTRMREDLSWKGSWKAG